MDYNRSFERLCARQLIWLALFLVPYSSTAQSLVLPLGFEQLMDSVQVELHANALTTYKVREVTKNDYLNYDLALYSRKEKLTIRCRIMPYNIQKTSSQFPNVEVGRLLTTLGSNTEDYYMTSRGIESEDLSSKYHADWGIVHFFKPKVGFSGHQHCKMLTLHKEHVGTIFVFYLFDDVKNEALEVREGIFSF